MTRKLQLDRLRPCLNDVVGDLKLIVARFCYMMFYFYLAHEKPQ